MLALLGYVAASFVMTAMIAQLFPDGRFPLLTILLVMLVSTAGAWAGDNFLSEASIFTGALVGATLTSALLFFLFHRTGILVQEPWPEENGNEGP
ncbi:MAG: hypothetical protein M3220_11600 [Chloroflexota bacterium]|nr:hypothetical protein [Chloroflexota bacterium]